MNPQYILTGAAIGWLVHTLICQVITLCIALFTEKETYPCNAKQMILWMGVFIALGAVLGAFK